MKKNSFSFYIILAVIGLTTIFLFPAPGKTEVESVVPGGATLISPSGVTPTTTPTYTWNAVPNATYYCLWVDESGYAGAINVWSSAAACGCASGTGTCSLTPATRLVVGPGKWWIQTWNNDGYGPWSNGMSFNINPCSKNSQNINSAGFAPVSSDVTYSSDTWGWKYRTAGTYDYFDAPVNLPIGAQITQVLVDYYDNDATGDVWVFLGIATPAGGWTFYPPDEPWVKSSGTPGYGRLTLDVSGVLPIIVDNLGHSYWIRVRLNATNSNNKFLGAIICYSPPSP